MNDMSLLVDKQILVVSILNLKHVADERVRRQTRAEVVLGSLQSLRLLLSFAVCS